MLSSCISSFRKIYPKLKEWQDQVRMVIIEGVGEKAFCAGADIRAVTDFKGSPSQGDIFREGYQALVLCIAHIVVLEST